MTTTPELTHRQSVRPWQHGEWLARNIPNAETVIEEHGGHLPDPDVIADAYAWLVQPV